MGGLAVCARVRIKNWLVVVGVHPCNMMVMKGGRQAAEMEGGCISIDEMR